MAYFKLFEAAGFVIFETSRGLREVFQGDGQLQVTAGTAASNPIKTVTFTDSDTSTVVAEEVPISLIQDQSGTVIDNNGSTAVASLQAICDVKLLSDFVVKDETTALTGTTKIRHKAGTNGADRDEAGTLELDTHAASIGLYGSYLKITEQDLSNTTGKSVAFGRVQVYLENQGTSYEALDIEMGSLSSAPNWDVYSYTTNWSAVNFNLTGDLNLKGSGSDVGVVRFYDTDDSHYIALKTGVVTSNQTFVLPQSDGTSGQALTTDGSGNLSFSSQQTLECQQIDFVTSSTALNTTGYEGEVLKIGNGSSMSFGQLRYMGAAGSPLTARWANANAGAASTSSGFLAFALGSSATSDGMLTRGYVYHSNSYTPGATLYVSKTSGGITDDISAYSTGDIVRIVGYAVNTGFIYFNPSTDFIELS